MQRQVKNSIHQVEQDKTIKKSNWKWSLDEILFAAKLYKKVNDDA
jgi:hypothetical protein